MRLADYPQLKIGQKNSLRIEVTMESMLMTANEAAATLAICPRTLWTLTSTGDLPAVRIGRSVRYTRADLKNFISARRTGESN